MAQSGRAGLPPDLPDRERSSSRHRLPRTRSRVGLSTFHANAPAAMNTTKATTPATTRWRRRGSTASSSRPARSFARSLPEPRSGRCLSQPPQFALPAFRHRRPPRRRAALGAACGLDGCARERSAPRCLSGAQPPRRSSLLRTAGRSPRAGSATDGGAQSRSSPKLRRLDGGIVQPLLACRPDASLRTRSGTPCGRSKRVGRGSHACTRSLARTLRPRLRPPSHDGRLSMRRSPARDPAHRHGTSVRSRGSARGKPCLISQTPGSPAWSQHPRIPPLTRQRPGKGLAFTCE